MENPKKASKLSEPLKVYEIRIRKYAKVVRVQTITLHGKKPYVDFIVLQKEKVEIPLNKLKA